VKHPVDRRTFVAGVRAVGLIAQTSIDARRRQKPTLVSRITDTKAPAPELVSKLKVQQSANRFALRFVNPL
jgi:putative spermidine/putrescine transport system substrate-binding protein